MGEKKKKMGTLKTIYILHGWTYETKKWNPFLTSLKRRGIDPILLEIPGLTAPLSKPWTLNDYVLWLNKKTRKKPFYVLGHSNGGRIALAYSLKYPKNIKQLILVDSAGLRRRTFTTRAKRILFKTAAKFGKKVFPKSSRSILYAIAREEDYKKASPMMQKTMKNLISVDLFQEIEKIKPKTTIIWGRKDKITPYKDALIMHRKIVNSTLYTIDNARHSPMFTHTSKVAQIIKSQLNEHI